MHKGFYEKDNWIYINMQRGESQIIHTNAMKYIIFMIVMWMYIHVYGNFIEIIYMHLFTYW